MSILSNKPQHRIIPIIALIICGTTTWELVWYPYRFLEQADVPSGISTGDTYFVAFLSATNNFSQKCPARINFLAGRNTCCFAG